ncbi:MAG: xanthine dehydrogenase YagT iron-sulfur-binding subunit, partial [Mycobacterium sp.]|nr:xanthine dehydrogenase YagT iron-sulfur-binding subunit [Mycobacterium sp.]
AHEDVPLLNVLRNDLGLMGTRFGCGLEQCGSCMVLIDGAAEKSCARGIASLAGKAITTIEGLGTPDKLHPMQAAFVKHDGFQCGYCTPGQICSAVGMLDELKAGQPSSVTDDLDQTPELSDAEIRERMSGNLCRCAAYPNIVAAIHEAAR